MLEDNPTRAELAAGLKDNAESFETQLAANTQRDSERFDVFEQHQRDTAEQFSQLFEWTKELDQRLIQLKKDAESLKTTVDNAFSRTNCPNCTKIYRGPGKEEGSRNCPYCSHRW